MAAQQPCGRLADLGNAECVDKPVEGNPPALVDRSHQITRAEFAPGFAVGDYLGVEPEDVAGLANESVCPKSSDGLLAEPLDVEAIPRHEMPQALDGLRGADQPASAATRHLAGLAHREAGADRAVIGKLVRHRLLWAAVKHD